MLWRSLQSYTADEFYEVLEMAGALTPKIIDIAHDLPSQKRFVVSIEIHQENPASNETFKPEDVTAVELRDIQEFQESVRNCEMVLKLLSNYQTYPPTILEFGKDRVNTLTLKIDVD